eukprot:359793-Chlamydomonas_euryale.AAC.1
MPSKSPITLEGTMREHRLLAQQQRPCREVVHVRLDSEPARARHLPSPGVPDLPCSAPAISWGS